MIVRLIQWLKPVGERDLVSPIVGTDYQNKWMGERSYHPGISNHEEGDDNNMMEYFVDVVEPAQKHNEEVELQNEVSYPTTENHPDYPEYRIFKVRTLAQKREIEAMVFQIKSKESEINNKLLSDGQFALANILATQMGITIAKDMPVTPEMKNGEIRFDEIYTRMGKNRACAEEKIRLAKLGEPYHIEEGWEIDNLTPLGVPFNDIA